MTGKELKELRERLKLSPQKFADLTGYSRFTLSRWENCKRKIIPRAEWLIKSRIVVK